MSAEIVVVQTLHCGWRVVLSRSARSQDGIQNSAAKIIQWLKVKMEPRKRFSIFFHLLQPSQRYAFLIG
ncbi:hypothetical protein RchiOBHm_Chr3g0449351 [Rosa chinensis]|uniref:Uncharacterized protein n=1 Tax=Rosa chinensis TaxID=74649 RepID=A0A2P6R5I5_ROSCH|nr:hypothetical protein RchiOBHm_Chr3g0449351 [Rosa chinensis]